MPKAEKTIVDVLMERDGLSEAEAYQNVSDFKQRILTLDSLEDMWAIEDDFQDEFGLEPDYLMDLVFELI